MGGAVPLGFDLKDRNLSLIRVTQNPCTIKIKVPRQLRHRGVEAKLVLTPVSGRKIKIDKTIVSLIANAHD